MVDERIRQLARNLVNYSCALKAGENILIEAIGVDYQIVNCIIEEVYKVGGCPFVTIKDNRVERALQKNMTREVAERQAEVDCFKMEKMQAYIGIRGGENAYETSDVPSKNSNAYNTYYSLPVHHERRVKNTKWVVLRYPTQGMSAMSAMSTEGFEDFYFKVCNLDYRKMDEAMTPLVELMNATDKVRIVAPNTDLSFSIKNIPA
ncbi:MAG: aminopeptidase, partial [Clostridia bacterium]